MNKVLNEMQQLRLSLAKESNFDLTKAEKVYNFVIGEQPVTVSDTTANPDGIHFILSPSNMIHESLATDVDKRKSIAIGVKMGNRFANVVLHDAVGGKEVALCISDKVPCGSEPFFCKTFKKAMDDWDGMANTNDMQINLQINLRKNEYIPSMAQLHLILLNINKINKALVEAEGESMKNDMYWSSTEYNSNYAWFVNFNSGYTNNDSKYRRIAVRPSIVCKL